MARIGPAPGDGSGRNSTAVEAIRSSLLQVRPIAVCAGPDHNLQVQARHARAQIFGQWFRVFAPDKEILLAAQVILGSMGLAPSATDTLFLKPRESSRAANAGPSANRRE